MNLYLPYWSYSDFNDKTGAALYRLSTFHWKFKANNHVLRVSVGNTKIETGTRSLSVPPFKSYNCHENFEATDRKLWVSQIDWICSTDFQHSI